MTSKWSVYLTGPDGSMHALGIVSVNFGNFECALVWLLVAVALMSVDEAHSIRLRNITACVNTIENLHIPALD
jgi:hypothetical protein